MPDNTPEEDKLVEDVSGAQKVMQLLHDCVDRDCPISVTLQVFGIPDVAPPVRIRVKRQNYVNSTSSKEQVHDTNFEGLPGELEEMIQKARDE